MHRYNQFILIKSSWTGPDRWLYSPPVIVADFPYSCRSSRPLTLKYTNKQPRTGHYLAMSGLRIINVKYKIITIHRKYKINR